MKVMPLQFQAVSSIWFKIKALFKHWKHPIKIQVFSRISSTLTNPEYLSKNITSSCGSKPNEATFGQMFSGCFLVSGVTRCSMIFLSLDLSKISEPCHSRLGACSGWFPLEECWVSINKELVLMWKVSRYDFWCDLGPYKWTWIDFKLWDSLTFTSFLTRHWQKLWFTVELNVTAEGKPL